jgi:hypothetical protein
MTTVASRTFRSIPHREAAQTWHAIVDLLTQGRSGEAKNELLSVSGIVASVIADQGPKEAPIVVTCDGPRMRIYCVYDDDALDDAEENEGALGFDPLNGDWRVSLPCLADDLSWVQAALKQQSERITARDIATGLSEESEARTVKAESLVLDPRGFLGS